MSHHTKGPWKVGTSGITVISENWSISVPLRLPLPDTIHDMCEGPKADARLIAAAPEMLELLKCYIGAHKSMTPQTLDRYDAEARALLAKVRGKE